MQCMFRIPQDGGRVLWEITNKCNYKCKYCIFNSGVCNDDELTYEEVKRVIDQLKKKDFKYLKITGGEPFIRKDIIDILKYASDKDMIVDVSTNASLINESMIKTLKDINLEMIHISLDGPSKEIHEMVRGINTYERTIKGIKKLKQTNKYIRIGTVIFKNNEEYLEDIIKLCISLNVNEVIFSIMEPVGRMLDDNRFVTTKSLDVLKDIIESLTLKYPEIIINYNWNPNKVNNSKTCPAGNRFLYINNKGNIAPCTWLVTNDNKYLSYLSLKDNNLEDVLNDKNIINFMEAKNKLEYDICLGKRESHKVDLIYPKTKVLEKSDNNEYQKSIRKI